MIQKPFKPWWSTACCDWETRIVAGESLVPIPPLFPSEAEEAVGFFKSLKIVDAPGSPLCGDACRKWVFDLVGTIFGAYDTNSGRQLINEFFLLISKKNAKSTIAAGIMLTALKLNWRMKAEFIIVAPTVEVANNSAGAAMDMVENDEELSSIFRTIRHLKTIEHRTTGAMLKILSADNDVVTGKKATGILFDELWLFGNKVKAEAMMREAKGGMASRPEGFVIALSTQGDDPPAGVFKQWLDRFRDIRDGKLHAPRSLGILYEFPQAMIEAERHLQPENWYVTNPNLGASVDMDFLLDEFEKAKISGEGSVRGFLAKHLNVEIGLNLRANRWRGADFWEAAADKRVTWEWIVENCAAVTVGIDGGGLDDLLGVTILGRDAANPKLWYSASKVWCTRLALDRRKSEATKLEGFVKDGDLIIIEDNNMDAAIAQVVEMVAGVHDAGKLAAVGLDQIGVGAIVSYFAEYDIIPVMAPPDQQGDRLLEGIAQGWKLKGAIYTTEIKLANGTLKHADQPIMNWCAGNAKAEMSGNAVMITKQAAGVGKIDPLIALFCAVVPMERNPKPVGRNSSYLDGIAAENEDEYVAVLTALLYD